jgi:hypothetical protein
MPETLDLEKNIEKAEEPHRPIAPETIDLSMISGAGEGIRTLDPNLGKVLELLRPATLLHEVPV